MKQSGRRIAAVVLALVLAAAGMAGCAISRSHDGQGTHGL